jgi:hypothetical protein
MPELNEYVRNPTTGEILHNPSGLCFGDDDVGNVRLLSPPSIIRHLIRRDQIVPITEGAREFLRREREGDPSIEYAWVDRAGRGKPP